MNSKITTTYFMSNPEWYDYDENEMPYLNDCAPPKARESYENWKEKYEYGMKTGIWKDGY